VYVTEVRDGTPSVIKAYDELRNNLFVGNYYGQEAVDNDDGSACVPSVCVCVCVSP
jgi:hypothetical protein